MVHVLVFDAQHRLLLQQLAATRDPSICRVGDDFYVVTSTFEYFPGLPIHTSRDLAQLDPGRARPRPPEPAAAGGRTGLRRPLCADHPLARRGLLRRLHAGRRDYVSTATSSSPRPTPPARGRSRSWLGEDDSFDPSLLFDGDDAWFCATRPRRDGGKAGPDRGLGPALRSRDLLAWSASRHVIWHGAMVDVVWAEAPHLYAVDGGYLLVVAEGGTAVHHSMTVARSDERVGAVRELPSQPRPDPSPPRARRARSRRSGTRTWSRHRTARGGRSALPSGHDPTRRADVRKPRPRDLPRRGDVGGRLAGRQRRTSARCATSSRLSRRLSRDTREPSATTSTARRSDVEWRYLRAAGRRGRPAATYDLAVSRWRSRRRRSARPRHQPSSVDPRTPGPSRAHRRRRRPRQPKRGGGDRRCGRTTISRCSCSFLEPRTAPGSRGRSPAATAWTRSMAEVPVPDGPVELGRRGP